MGQIHFPKPQTKFTPSIQKNKKSGSFVTNLLLQIVFIGISIFMFYNVGRSVYMASAKLAILEQAEQEVEKLRLENIALVLQNEEASSDDYVEKQARDRLNYARDGETQCVISDTLIESYELEMGQSEDQDNGAEDVLGAQTKSNFQVWIDFFVDGI